MADNRTIRRAGTASRSAVIDAGLRAHMNKVYGLMSIGLAVTGIVAYVFGTDAAAVVDAMKLGLPASAAHTMLIPAGMIESLFFSPLRYAVMFAPLIMIFVMGGMINRMSQSTAQMMFYGFSALMGLSISWIFAVYTGFSITSTFFITAIAFAGLSLYGYTTKKDISAWGSFLIMGVIGLIIAIIVNIFLASPAIQFAISFLGVLIFSGLTAYDTQKIKATYLQMAGHPDGQAWLGKAAIMGALNLYLDFVNIFMFLLQLMGGSRD